MPTKRYRWHVVETLRGARRSRAHSALGQARQQLERAELALKSAEQALATHGTRAPQPPAYAAAASTLELQRAAAFWNQHTGMQRELRGQLQQAQAERARRLAQLNAEQLTFAERSAEQRAIVLDRGQSERMLQRKRDSHEQIELEERIRQKSGRAASKPPPLD